MCSHYAKMIKSKLRARVNGIDYNWGAKVREISQQIYPEERGARGTYGGNAVISSTSTCNSSRVLRRRLM